MGIFDSFRKKKPEDQSAEVRHQTPPKPQGTAGLYQVGDRIDGRYEIRQILGGPGKSGMGIVYVCYDHEWRTPVALKTLQDKFLTNQPSIDRFKWEAETWVRLERHHNIVRAKLVETVDGRPYIIMEYIAGDKQYGADLSGWIWGGALRQNGRPDIPLILNFSLQFCHGMIHARKKFQEMGKPFVHRDVKPSNILVTQDRVVKVTDFGLVKAFAQSVEDIPSTMIEDGGHQRLSLSKSGGACGTPPYMSPEQCRGDKEIDERSDIYAFGCVLYEMLTGRYVFEARTPEEFIRHHLSSAPRSPGSQRELDRVVLKCLEKEPGNRYQGFHELEQVLAKLYLALTGEVVMPPEGAPLEAWELHNKGTSLANLGFTDEAIGCYKEALRINPNLAMPHNNLGNTYKARGQVDEAIAEYKEALRINPNSAVAHNNLGIVYKAKGALDSAMREYKEALRIDPNFAEAHYNLGNAYYGKKGDLDAAMAEWREAIRINPNYAEAHNNLGNAYKDKRHFDAAIRECQEAIRINPNHPTPHLSLGSVYYANGQMDYAMTEYQEAIRINPNYAEAHNNLALALEQMSRYGDALNQWKVYLQVARGIPSQEDWITKAQQHIDDLEKKT